MVRVVSAADGFSNGTGYSTMRAKLKRLLFVIHLDKNVLESDNAAGSSQQLNDSPRT